MARRRLTIWRRWFYSVMLVVMAIFLFTVWQTRRGGYDRRLADMQSAQELTAYVDSMMADPAGNVARDLGTGDAAFYAQASAGDAATASVYGIADATCHGDGTMTVGTIHMPIRIVLSDDSAYTDIDATQRAWLDAQATKHRAYYTAYNRALLTALQARAEEEPAAAATDSTEAQP